MEDPILKYALEHQDDFAQLIDSAGWKELQQKAVDDIAAQQSSLIAANLDQNSSLRLAYVKGYVDAITTLINYPEGMVMSARAEEASQ